MKSGEHLSRVNEAKAEGEEPTTSGNDEERQCPTYDKKVAFKEEAEGAKGPEDEPAVAKLNSQKRFGSELQIRRAGSHNLAVNGDESPFRSVVNKADFHARLQSDVRLTIEEDDDEEEAQRFKLKSIFKEPKTVIQDMIDMSLSKKKLATSEKMLCKAFIEFYRGLNLLKSYR